MLDEVDQPLGDADEFGQMLIDLVNDYAPRRFAICEEYGDRIDAEVFAWGMAFDDVVVLCADDMSFTGCFSSAPGAVRRFSKGGRRMRLIWIDERPPGDPS